MTDEPDLDDGLLPCLQSMSQERKRRRVEISEAMQVMREAEKTLASATHELERVFATPSGTEQVFKAHKKLINDHRAGLPCRHWCKTNIHFCASIQESTWGEWENLFRHFHYQWVVGLISAKNVEPLHIFVTQNILGSEANDMYGVYVGSIKKSKLRCRVKRGICLVVMSTTVSTDLGYIGHAKFWVSPDTLSVRKTTRTSDPSTIHPFPRSALCMTSADFYDPT